MALLDYLKEYKVDTFSFPVSFRKNVLEHLFSEGSEALIFFDLEENIKTEDLVQEEIRKKNTPFDLVIMNKETFTDSLLFSLLSFYMPYLYHKNFNIVLDLEDILEILGYSGDIRTGFIFFNVGNDSSYVIEYSDIDLEEKSSPISKIRNFYSDFNEKTLRSYVCYGRPSFSKRHFNDTNNKEFYAPPASGMFYKSIDERINDDTRNYIEQIDQQLLGLKKSGQLYLVLPLLEKMLQEHYATISSEELSPIYILMKITELYYLPLGIWKSL